MIQQAVKHYIAGPGWQAQFAGMAEAEMLAIAKEQLHLRISEQRVHLEGAGYSHNGKLIATDDRSLMRIGTAASSAQTAVMTSEPWEVQWTCADGSDVALNASGMLVLHLGIARRGAAIHYAARALHAEVDAAESLACCEGVAVQLATGAGWPS